MVLLATSDEILLCAKVGIFMNKNLREFFKHQSAGKQEENTDDLFQETDLF